MRELKIIEAEIAKLQAEATDVRMDASKKNAAVSILGNLGWTWTAKFGWKKPEVKHDVKLKDHKAPVKSGDFATYDAGVLSGNVFVREVNYHSGTARVSWLRNVMSTHRALICSEMFSVKISEITPRHKEWFIGREL